ncbi:hypothetical protein B0H14DRAFT_1173216 [Mycena olivaceomarginata]|nr:hypothetical protein B0H14DRAFT_1173216 [Mycena olivaceomarginata]
MESEIRGVAADVQTVQQAIHKILPRNISDPFFYVRNPLGERIPIPLSAYHIFDDLDRILRAYCHRPETGSRYVERGDYSIVSPDGAIIPRLRLRREVKAGIEFDMSIIQRKRWRPAPEKCHHCGHTNADAAEGTWVNCLNCEARYQVSRWIEEISSPQIFRQDGAEPFREDDQGESEDGQEESEDHKEESFPLVQIFYVSLDVFSNCHWPDHSLVRPHFLFAPTAAVGEYFPPRLMWPHCLIRLVSFSNRST